MKNCFSFVLQCWWEGGILLILYVLNQCIILYSCSQMLSCVFFYCILYFLLRPKVVLKGVRDWNISEVLPVLCHCFSRGDFCLNFSNWLVFMSKFSKQTCLNDLDLDLHVVPVCFKDSTCSDNGQAISLCRVRFL